MLTYKVAARSESNTTMTSLRSFFAEREVVLKAVLPEMVDIVAAARDQSSNFGPLSEEYNVMVDEIARTGEMIGDWRIIQRVFALKMVQVLKSYYAERGFAGLKEHTYENRCEELLLMLQRFTDAPFTVQRLAEVLNDASQKRSQYQSTHKLMNCFEKLLSVSSTV